jgi:hypothetical protein
LLSFTHSRQPLTYQLHFSPLTLFHHSRPTPLPGRPPRPTPPR